MMMFSVLLLTACNVDPGMRGTGSKRYQRDEEKAVQVVNVGLSGPNYVLDRAVEAGKPVRLVFDASQLVGCSRAVVVLGYGQKVITLEDNVIEFTPDASGELTFSCSMDMYHGELMAE